MPERYDACLGPALFAPYAQHVADLAATWSPRRVLEIAAGTGIGTAALVAALPGAQITATDLNAAMVAWAAERVRGATWEQADAQDLGLEPGSFDLVVCQFGAMFFPDRPGAYAQMRAVLAPGGRVLLTIWDTVEGSELTLALVGCLREVFPEDPPMFVVRTPHGYADPDQITADVEAGGLTDVRVDRVVLQGLPTTAAVFVQGFCEGTPLRFELDKRGDLSALAAQLTDLLVARVGSEPVSGSLAAYVVTARRP